MLFFFFLFLPLVTPEPVVLDTVEEFLTPNECEKVIALAKEKLEPEPGLAQGYRIDQKLKISTVRTIDPQNPDGWRWLLDRLLEIVHERNEKVWQYKGVGKGIAVQIVNYNAEEKAHYDFHRDEHILSATVQLKLHSSYTGGDLEIAESSVSLRRASKEKGSLTLFPSYVLHRVMPLQKGSRWALVVWFSKESEAGQVYRDQRRHYYNTLQKIPGTCLEEEKTCNGKAFLLTYKIAREAHYLTGLDLQRNNLESAFVSFWKAKALGHKESLRHLAEIALCFGGTFKSKFSVDIKPDQSVLKYGVEEIEELRKKIKMEENPEFKAILEKVYTPEIDDTIEFPQSKKDWFILAKNLLQVLIKNDRYDSFAYIVLARVNRALGIRKFEKYVVKALLGIPIFSSLPSKQVSRILAKSGEIEKMFIHIDSELRKNFLEQQDKGRSLTGQITGTYLNFIKKHSIRLLKADHVDLKEHAKIANSFQSV
eukprot:g1877.t1